MKKSIVLGMAILFTGSLPAADPTPKEEITQAAKQLGEKPNYTWNTTVVVPENARFRPGPTEGKTEKAGFTYLKLSFGDNEIEAAFKGDKGAVTTQEGWRSFAELEEEQGRGRFLGLMMRNAKRPVAEAAELAGFAKELKKEGDTYSSDLTEAGAKELLTFKVPGREPPAVSNANGSVKFWLKDGGLAKYEFKLKGAIDFNGNTIDSDRTTTVEIKEVGTTKVEVPEEAKKKLDQPGRAEAKSDKEKADAVPKDKP
jgi:hypothetical protein